MSCWVPQISEGMNIYHIHPPPYGSGNRRKSSVSDDEHGPSIMPRLFRKSMDAGNVDNEKRKRWPYRMWHRRASSMSEDKHDGHGTAEQTTDSENNGPQVKSQRDVADSSPASQPSAGKEQRSRAHSDR